MNELKSYEKEFNIKPMGVKYICEYCNEGEMKFSAPNNEYESLYNHICDKCNGELSLPKIYPYIKWEPEE